MFTITLKADALKALLITAADADVRHYLNGVCVDLRDVSRPMLVSSDGHRMTVYGAAELTGEAMAGTYVIPRDALKAVKAAGKHGMVTIDIEPKNFSGQDGGTFAIHGHITSAGTLIECKYIEWPRVVPAARTLEEITPAHFDFNYLGDIGRIAKLLGCKHPLIIPNGDSGACVLLGPDAFGVLMPLRERNAAKEPCCAFPTWYPAASKPVKVRKAA